MDRHDLEKGCTEALTPWLMNPEVQCRIHKGPPIIPNLSLINPIFFKIYSNIILPSTPSLPKDLFPAGVPVKILKALLPFSILATLPVLLRLLDLITLTMLGERYKL